MTTGEQPDRRRARREMDRLPQHGPGQRHARHLHRVLPVVHRAHRPGNGRTPTRQSAPRDQQLLGLPPERRLHRRPSSRRSSRTRGRPASRWSSPPAMPERLQTVPIRPPIYDASFSIGATNSATTLASFCSRGPVTVDGSGRHEARHQRPRRGTSLRGHEPATRATPTFRAPPWPGRTWSASLPCSGRLAPTWSETSPRPSSC